MIDIIYIWYIYGYKITLVHIYVHIYVIDIYIKELSSHIKENKTFIGILYMCVCIYI